MHKPITFFLLCLAAITFNSCGKEETRDVIPYVYVNFAMYPNTIDFIRWI